MNDTDIYADAYRVAYHPEPGTEHPASPRSDPGGRGLETALRNRGDAT